MVKKIILVMSIVILALICCACNNTPDVITSDVIPYYSQNMEDFINTWKSAQNVDGDKRLNANNNEKVLIIPEISYEDYKLFLISATEYSYDYYFTLSSYEGGIGNVAQFSIVVSVSKYDNSFENIRQEYNLSGSDEIYLNDKNNVWYVNQGNKCVSISFNNGEVVKSADDLNSIIHFDYIHP